jgi:hypothetical protein
MIKKLPQKYFFVVKIILAFGRNTLKVLEIKEKNLQGLML